MSNHRKFQVKYGTLLSCFSATLRSLAIERNNIRITEEQWIELRSLYEQTLRIQQKVVCGLNDAEDSP